MSVLEVGQHVTWVRGAVGLSGLRVGEPVHLDTSCPGRDVVVFVQTRGGRFAEYPRNLALTSSLTAEQKAELLAEQARLCAGCEYSVERGWAPKNGSADGARAV